MNKPRMLRKQVQAGFTLIELVVVIVILGILAATALPKFADMGADARLAKVQAGLGAVKSASATFHAQWLVAGSPASTTVVKMENESVAHANGYPTVAGIKTAAGGLTDYDTVTVTGTTLTVKADSTHATCSFTYTEATASAPPQFVMNATPDCK